MTVTTDFAILAPVPLVHLEDGAAVAQDKGWVAYGSRKFELFLEIDARRAGCDVPMLIYPSHEDDPTKMTYRVTWVGWYTEFVRSVGGRHPQGMEYRPPSTADSTSDNLGHWAIFWHVRNLMPLPKDEQVPISAIGTVKGGWRKNHPPRGPEIVAVPPQIMLPE